MTDLAIGTIVGTPERTGSPPTVSLKSLGWALPLRTFLVTVSVVGTPNVFVMVQVRLSPRPRVTVSLSSTAPVPVQPQIPVVE